MTTKDYEPHSGFLRDLIRRVDPLGSSQSDQAILRQLIEMTQDENPKNRDWATFLLWQQDVDTPEVRNALLSAGQDDDAAVRAEAIRGLAELAPDLSLPLIRRELAGSSVSAPIFEAAAIVADPSLAEDLRAFQGRSANRSLDRLAEEALSACEARMRELR